MKSTVSPVNMEARKNLDLRPGDTVRVHQKIEEKGKTRIQIFEGMVLARKHGTEAGATFTVRRNQGGYGVEKIYPLYSPMIDKIEVVKRSKTRSSKLYFVRRKALKEISKRMKMMFVKDVSSEVEEQKIEDAKPKDEPKPETPAESDADTKTEAPAEAEVAETPESEESEAEKKEEAPAETKEEEEKK
jgi:large subunit ribosomal protein L19